MFVKYLLGSSCSSHVTSAVDEDSISEFSLITPLVSYLQQDDKDSCSPGIFIILKTLHLLLYIDVCYII